jgi:hypothetical protein
MIFEYPPHEIFDSILQILFASKYPIYGMTFDQCRVDTFCKKRVFSEKHIDSLSIEPTNKTMHSDITLTEIISQNSSNKLNPEGKCWLLTQNL